MPEYPDITVYIEAIGRYALGRTLNRLAVRTPFLIRTYQPPVESLHNRQLVALRRIGKRIAFGFSNGHWLSLHLMIAGRLHWNSRRKALAAFEFDNGSLSLTEAGSRRQAAIHLFADEASLDAIDPGGLEVMDAGFEAFAARLTAENHTLKRALTDPHILSGIGNAYSDEILHAAKLSPFRMTSSISDDEIATLHLACIRILNEWTQRTRDEVGDGFPDKVTAFREEMAVHGKYRAPCPVCGTPVQRIVYADNEANYCPTCQTEGRLLADRSLSRLLKEDWPKTLEELEDRRAARVGDVGKPDPGTRNKLGKK